MTQKRRQQFLMLFAIIAIASLILSSLASVLTLAQ